MASSTATCAKNVAVFALFAAAGACAGALAEFIRIETLDEAHRYADSLPPSAGNESDGDGEGGGEGGSDRGSTSSTDEARKAAQKERDPSMIYPLLGCTMGMVAAVCWI